MWASPHDPSDRPGLTAETACLIDAVSLSYSYGAKRRPGDALRGLTAAVGGQAAALLGPNGAGKSTLISLVVGARQAQAGGLNVLDADMNVKRQRKDLQRRLGFVPQSLSIFSSYTVADFLRYVCYLRRISSAHHADEIQNCLRAVDLESQQNSRIKRLSGGTKQRVKLAQALLGRPDVIILDEPTVGLDPEQRATFLDVLLDVKSSTRLVIATHLVEDVARVCDSVMILQAGRSVFSGPVGELVSGEVSGAGIEDAYRRAIRR